MANIRIDLNHTPLAGEAIKFKAPCDAKDITGLTVYYVTDANEITSKEFTLTDANGGDIGAVDNIFSTGAIVKVILDTDANNAFVQNPDTNTYLERRFEGKANKEHTHTADKIMFADGDTIQEKYNNGDLRGANVLTVIVDDDDNVSHNGDQIFEHLANGGVVVCYYSPYGIFYNCAGFEDGCAQFLNYEPEEGFMRGIIITSDGGVEVYEQQISGGGSGVLTVTLDSDGNPDKTPEEVHNHILNGGTAILYESEADDFYAYVGGNGYACDFLRYEPEEGYLYGFVLYEDSAEYYEKVATSDPASRSWVQSYVSQQLGVIENGTY